MFDWEMTRQGDEEISARLEGTLVKVLRAPGGAPEAWRWEVHFADGQVQQGHAADREAALEKGKRVAERFLS